MPGGFRMALYLRAVASARSTTSTRLNTVMTCGTVTWVAGQGPYWGHEGQGLQAELSCAAVCPAGPPGLLTLPL